MSCVVGVWLVELPSSSMMYWKVPRLIVKKTNGLTQAVVFCHGVVDTFDAAVTTRGVGACREFVYTEGNVIPVIVEFVANHG